MQKRLKTKLAAPVNGNAGNVGSNYLYITVLVSKGLPGQQTAIQNQQAFISTMQQLYLKMAMRAMMQRQKIGRQPAQNSPYPCALYKTWGKKESCHTNLFG